MVLEDERDEDAYSSESANEDKIEYASDDGHQSQEDAQSQVKRRGKKRDEAFTEMDIRPEDEFDDQDDVLMNELENESFSIDSEEKKRRKEFQKLKRGRNLAQEADLGECDELGDSNTIFIDNLPSDPFTIRKTLVEARRLVKEQEIRFFEEEDSDKEVQLKSTTNVKHHEQALQNFREASNLKNFWCVPLSVDVRTFNFDLLA